MNTMKTINIIAKILLVVWWLNWGLYVFDINLVNIIFGSIPILENTVYLLVALSALIVLVNLAHDFK